MTCTNCGAVYQAEMRKIKYRKKVGQVNFFCSRSCHSKYKSARSYDISQHSGNRWDELSPYREYMRGILRRSRTFGWVVTVTLKDIRDLRIKQQDKCPYTGIKMIFPSSISEHSKVHDLRKASIDRIDSSKSYVVDNIQFLPIGLNWAKNNHTDEDFRKFIEEIQLGG